MSFLQNYAKFVENTEAHKNYHLWCALYTVSTLVSRKVWIEQGHFTIFPNIYTVLVGPPGNRKTSAMSTAKSLIRKFPEQVPLSAEAVTKEALVRLMAEGQRTFEWGKETVNFAPMAICVTELSQFLGPGADRMVDFLTTIYDEPQYEYRTKNAKEGEKKVDLILGPYVSMLACTTPSWITSYLKSDIISGGFSRRALFVFEADRGPRIAFPSISQESKRAGELCVEYAAQLVQTKGPFTWEDGAAQWYEEWYKSLVIPVDGPTAGYYETKHIQLLKVTMLWSLAHDLEKKITIKFLQEALEVLDLMEKNLPRVFEGFGRNELNASAAYIMDLTIRMGGAIADKDLQSKTFNQINYSEYTGVMMHLRQTGKLIEHTAPSSKDPKMLIKWWITPDKAKSLNAAALALRGSDLKPISPEVPKPQSVS